MREPHLVPITKVNQVTHGGVKGLSATQIAGKDEIEMAGVMVFKTLADALRAGYHVYDRTEHGYLVRTRTTAGWAMAIVSCR